MGFAVGGQPPKSAADPRYRIEPINGMYSPQMEHDVRGTVRWFSLLRNGYWADPDGWNIDPSDGENVVVLMETREMAEAAIARAKKINARVGD